MTANAKSSTQTAPVVTAIDGPDGPDGNNGGEGKDVSGTFTRIAWRPTKAVAYGVAEAQVAAVDGKFYMFGGFDSRSPYGCCRPTDRTFSFNPATETWNRLKPLPPMNGTGHGGVTHSGFATDGKNIYLAGGYTTNKKHTQQIFGTQEVWRYNVADDSYTRLPNLPEARSAGVLEYYGGKLYFFGGSNASRKRDTGELFILDLKSGATGWRRGSPMPNPRNHLASAQLNGLIYANRRTTRPRRQTDDASRRSPLQSENRPVGAGRQFAQSHQPPHPRDLCRGGTHHRHGRRGRPPQGFRQRLRLRPQNRRLVGADPNARS